MGVIMPGDFLCEGSDAYRNDGRDQRLSCSPLIGVHKYDYLKVTIN